MADEQAQDREWIAAGANHWERRSTKKKAVAALKKTIGNRLRGRTMAVAEVPPGAWVDQMGRLRWHRPDNWDEMTPEDQRAYEKINREDVEIPA